MIFHFKNYGYDKVTSTAWFEYAHDNGVSYREEIQLTEASEGYNQEVFDRTLFLAFLLVGTSYYKSFPTRNITFSVGGIDSWQASFLNKVYQEGLSQYAFENELTRQDLAQFTETTGHQDAAVSYTGGGVLALQSGGKDSLLVAQLLEQKGISYDAWYVASGSSYPAVLDRLNATILVSHRQIDIPAIKKALSMGGKNGHVPVTYIVLSYALLQAVLLGKNTILAAVAHEGEEPHGWIDDLPVNHQWSKTWPAEQLFSEYVKKYVSADIQIGSPLRHISELRLTELFSEYAWGQVGDAFSSCNIANYKQGVDNSRLSWCGECPKCANSYLLFAPFIDKTELDKRLGGDLFKKPQLIDTFKGLLGVDGIMKPFECVGEVGELRLAYELAKAKGFSELPFDVPSSNFSKNKEYESQEWAKAMLQ